jgi:cellulose synthase (UDP-forming)
MENYQETISLAPKAPRGQSRLRTLGYRVQITLNTLLTAVYLAWRALYTIPVEYGVVATVAGVLLFVVELLGMFEAMIHYYNMADVHPKPVPEVPRALFPDVDIFIATYNEPCELLEKTINGCLHLKYPDRRKVHIYLCDDGRREEARELAARMRIGYLDRPDNSHAKAGNLNNALQHTSSPYVVTLDADMIPHSNFLLRTLPYFLAQTEDEKPLAFVQTPQAFYNPDLFQFNLYSEDRIPNEQDYFYRDIQVSRNKSNSVIYGGTNTVLRRAALESIGGFYTGTITEDYGTGILLQKKGYAAYATNEVLASGLSPTDLQSLIAQRIRWARGVISTNRDMHIWTSSELTLAQKLNYWNSEWYWFFPFKRMLYYFSPILFAVFGVVVVKCDLRHILLFWLPAYISSNISLRMLSRDLRTSKWTALYETVLFPFLLWPVLKESLGIRMRQFKVTRKGAQLNEDGKRLAYALPFVLMGALSLLGGINCVRMMLHGAGLAPLVVLFWLGKNCYALVMALFFVMGRRFVRRNERAQVRLRCEMLVMGGVCSGRTADISEGGLALVTRQHPRLEPGAQVRLKVWDERYKAQLFAQLLRVDRCEDGWRYAFEIIDDCDTGGEYWQLIYDRVPTLPQKLDREGGSLEDLRVNIVRRFFRPLPKAVQRTQENQVEQESKTA